MCHLCFDIEWIDEYDVDLVLLLVLRGQSCCHECEVRTTFNSQILWVKAYVLKVTEFKPAYEFFILLKIKNVLGFLFSLVNILKNNLIVPKVVSNTRHV
jgi:hypothetical protein